MTFKRQELRAGNTICLTTADIEIINLIGKYLRKKKSAILTELYHHIAKERGLEINCLHVKYCLMIMFIRKKIKINNWIKHPHQRQFRTTITLLNRKKIESNL